MLILKAYCPENSDTASHGYMKINQGICMYLKTIIIIASAISQRSLGKLVETYRI